MEFLMRFLAFWVLMAGAALANDGYSEIGIGGLVLKNTDKFSMDSEELFISEKEIRVAYEFSNLTDKDIEASVVFPLPDLVLSDEFESARGLVNFEKHLAFQTEVDGKPFPITLEQRAFVGATDISAVLQDVGLPVSADVEDFSGALRALPAEKLKRLISAGAIELFKDDNGNDIPLAADHFLMPLWTVKSQMVRAQVFPAGKTLKVKHRYVPVVGSSVQTYFPPPEEIAKMDETDRAEFEREAARYCYDDGFWKAFAKRVKKEKGNVGFPTNVSYILASGATWAGPIKDFRLVVDKGRADALVSFCGEGVTKISPTQFEMRKTNFEPKQNLDVMIVNWNRE
jgi:hypothetical protein